MRVPYKWLLDYVGPGLDPAGLAERLTQAGLEVGALERFGPSLPAVVVARVLDINPHPGRENLLLVSVHDGGENRQIVCGARNLVPGDLVPLALPGACLPGGREIGITEIHGVQSAGMLCSAPELALELGGENEILVLDTDTAVGQPLEQCLGLDDMILHLELTPNRADCLSMLGVAHEVAALTGSTVRYPSLGLAEVASPVEGVVAAAVADKDLCPRYTLRIIEGLKLAPSPLWMRLRLLQAGIRPISNIVDCTNYVMWEFGQPLHAFDLDLLPSREILVRRAREGEKLVTLDGVQRTLNPEALVITDGKKPVGLAGVMGGESTEISNATQRVLLEAAVFNPTNIRRTARRFNLPSEASQRFEKGVNPEAVLWSQDRASLLMTRLAGGRILRGVIDLAEEKPEKRRLTVNPRRINSILGLDLGKEEMSRLLERLDFSVTAEKDEHLAVTVPLRRLDVYLEEDVAEEVARLHGYENIPLTLPRGEMVATQPSREDRIRRIVRETLAAQGFFECITYSFINPLSFDLLDIPPEDGLRRAIPVQNPFSEEQAVMRTTLLPGLLKTVGHNFSHREMNMLLFEVGAVFLPGHLPLRELPQEEVRLGLAASGLIPEPNWIVPSGEADFFTLKGAVEAILVRLGFEGGLYTPAELPFCHPTRCARVSLDDEELGFIGQLHPRIATAWGLVQDVYVGELNLAVFEQKARLVPRAQSLPRYPAARRDLALVVSRDVPAARLEKAIYHAGGGMVSRVHLFDHYEGSQIPTGMRSLAYALTFRREEGTLTDADVNLALKGIEEALRGLGASLRSR